MTAATSLDHWRQRLLSKEATVAEVLATPGCRTTDFCTRVLDEVETLIDEAPGRALEVVDIAMRLAAGVSDSLFARACRLRSLVKRRLGDDAAADAGSYFAEIFDGGHRPLAIEQRHAEAALDRGELDKAEELARGLVRQALTVGARHFRGVGHVLLAEIHRSREHGSTERSDETRREVLCNGLEALRHLDDCREPELFLQVVHRLAHDFPEDGHLMPRFGALVREIRLQRSSPGRLPWSLLRWLEGLALHRRGQLSRAAATINGSRRRLLKAGHGLTALALAIDLAEIYLDMDDGRAARLMVRSTLEARSVVDLGPEVLGTFQDYVAVLCVANDEGGHRERIAVEAARVRRLGLV